jgi:hypothetical protein
MSTSASRRPAAHATMFRLVHGHIVARLIHVVAQLGVADALGRRAATAVVLAKELGVHAAALRRVLRTLASLGIFSEDQKGRFRLTALGRTLCKEGSGSLRDFSIMTGRRYIYQALSELEHGVRTGGSPFAYAHHASLFEFLRARPEEERIFAAGMASISGTESQAVAAAYPFGRFRKVIDVGGGQGHLLAAILRRHRRLQGVLFDLPPVVGIAAQSGFLAKPDIADRCTSVGGSFFDGMPVRADGYVMKNVLHDWDDDRCMQILVNCRKAMLPGGRVLVVEHVLGPPNTDFEGKLYDVSMMLLTSGGRERNRKEWEALLRRSGLRLNRVVRTRGPLCIVEARQA